MVSRGLLTTQQAADYLGLSRTYLEKRRVTKKDLKFVKLGRAVRYRLSDLDAFIEAGLRQSTSDSGSAQKAGRR